jgi:predicted GNAT family acetyltransferase
VTSNAGSAESTEGIRHDPDRRFHIEQDGDVAYLAYKRVDDHTVDYISTYVPPTLRGRGLGERLVRHAVEWARHHGQTVIPTCPFVRKYLGG